MIVELLNVLSIFFGGVALMRISGINGWVLPALGFVAGIAIQIVVGTFQAVTALPTMPVLTLAITLFLPLAWWLWCYSRGQDVSVKIIPAILVIAFIASAVVILREINLQCVTVDSFFYLTISSLLEGNNLNHASPTFLMTRLLAVPLIHSAANLADEFYFRSITPLLALSTLIILIWLALKGLSISAIEPRLIKLLSIIGALLLATNNRFVFNALYINGHMLTAVFLLLLIGCGWLLVKKADVPPKALLVLQVLSIPVLTVTRPENSLFVCIALLPLLISKKVPWKIRAILMSVLGFSLICWHSFLWIEYYSSGEVMPISVVAMSGLGLAVMLSTPLLAWRKIDNLLSYSPVLVEIGLWLALLVFYLRHPAPFHRSIFATIYNVLLYEGGWGVSLILLGLISIGVLVFARVSDRLLLRFPLTTFIPFSFLLIYLREGAYRIGHGDSLNRMFLHIIPVAILFIISTAASEEWGLPERLRNTWQRLITSAKNEGSEY